MVSSALLISLTITIYSFGHQMLTGTNVPLCQRNAIKIKLSNDNYCKSDFTFPKYSNLWNVRVYHTKLTIGISDVTMYKITIVLRAIQVYSFLFPIALFIVV